jgi:hypothetical protein
MVEKLRWGNFVIVEEVPWGKYWYKVTGGKLSLEVTVGK